MMMMVVYVPGTTGIISDGVGGCRTTRLTFPMNSVLSCALNPKLVSQIVQVSIYPWIWNGLNVNLCVGHFERREPCLHSLCNDTRTGIIIRISFIQFSWYNSSLQKLVTRNKYVPYKGLNSCPPKWDHGWQLLSMSNQSRKQDRSIIQRTQYPENRL